MAGKKVYLAVAVVGIGVLSGAAWWFQQSGRPLPWAASSKADKAAAPSDKGGAGGAMPAGGPGAGAPAGAPGAGGGGGGKGPGGPGGPGGGRGGPAAVEVAVVQSTRIVDDTQSVGTLRARQGVVLRPEVSGRIKTLTFTDGQRVKRGDLLVQLDDTLQQAQLKQAEASAAIARTNLQRSRELAAQNFVSQSAVDQNAAALDVALAQVALAQAQIQRMRVLAPFDGVTGIRLANVGDYLKDGAEIVAVEDLSSLFVDFRLPERTLTRLRTGQEVELTLDAVPGKTFPAKVVALDAQVDANGRAVLVRANLANPQGQLRGGMFARVRTVFSTRDQALVVPEEALVPAGDRQLVFKVVDGEAGAKVAQRQPVKVGTRLPGKAEVLDGLKEGDVIVVAGQARLMQGNNPPVRIVDLSRRGGGGAGGPGGQGGPGGPGGGSGGPGGPGGSGGGGGAGGPGGPGGPGAGGGAPGPGAPAGSGPAGSPGTGGGAGAPSAPGSAAPASVPGGAPAKAKGG